MTFEEQWLKMYKYANIYFDYYGNLYIPVNFKTLDGFTYNDKGFNLGQWISTQRHNYSQNKLAKEKILLLEKICMIWNTGIYKQNIIIMCINNKIDYNINKDILSTISIQELDSKIRYLFENGIPLMDENGKLHEIFRIDSNSMKEKYGFSLREIIDKYYQTDVCKRRK